METGEKCMCPECGLDMKWTKWIKALHYKGYPTCVTLAGFWCFNCGEGVLAEEELKKKEDAYKALKSMIDDYEDGFKK